MKNTIWLKLGAMMVASTMLVSGCGKSAVGSVATAVAPTAAQTENPDAAKQAADAQSTTQSAAQSTAVQAAAETNTSSAESVAPGETTANATLTLAPTGTPEAVDAPDVTSTSEVTSTPEPTATPEPDVITTEQVSFDPTWLYAGNSKINSGIATLYHAQPSIAKHKTVCVNAGHGTEGGGSVKTLCHPDGSPKVTGGSTAEGQIEATAVASGMDFADGTPEYKVTVALAIQVRDALLMDGFDVLMIREGDDVQLDNIARTLMANNKADCHIALHYDSTTSDKGVFFMSVPQYDVYLSMEPVASHWQDHDRLGRAVVAGISAQGFKLFDNGELPMDLTQTSYSTVPSIDLECGDAVSDHTGATYPGLAAGITAGVNAFFGFN